ncbi:MAG: glycosyltransferase [Cytophagaceae bacterium]|jgi:glycosyltransferase involved in cell wall biosynthesis|nr:glycosyltransferase [Cytophagaceae bacterium]
MQNKIAKVLFLSYDGMTDPLGQSQVLPYIVGLAKRGISFSLISFEKKDRFEANKKIIESICEQYSIKWHPLPFHSFPPIASKLYDNYTMKSLAEKLHKQERFDLIHCRSYISAGVGEYLKKKYHVKFLFDMRGFWVDERIEGGIWPQHNPLFKLIYAWYKRKEASLIKNSDGIISLTEAAKKEISGWKSYLGAPITVIPCCADFDHFTLISKEEKREAKLKLGLSESTMVVTYLGSIGTWYLLDEMLEFFYVLLQQKSDSVFQFITPDPAEYILERAKHFQIPTGKITIQFAQRKDLKRAIAPTDIGLLFIKETYSKIASSPTKLGELLAMGIPVVCNAKVGDVASIVETTQGGISLRNLNVTEYVQTVAQLDELIALDRNTIRENSFAYYDLNVAISRYSEVYAALFLK